MSNRSRISVASASALLILVAGGFVYLRGTSTPVAVDDAVERFRASTPAPTAASNAGEQDEPGGPDAAERPAGTPLAPISGAAAPPFPEAGIRPLPAEGVYVYATTGYDHVDALGGSRHDYPDETTITVRHGGCAFTERWDVLAERWDERESCRTPGGDRLHRVTSYHSFFRQGDTRTLDCQGFTYPASAEPGDTWTTSCTGAGDEEDEATFVVTTLRAVGWETVEVAGRQLETLHVRADSEITGEQQGESHRDVWGSRELGIVLRERASVRSESTQPAIGKVTYTEEYEIRLTSLEPRT